MVEAITGRFGADLRDERDSPRVALVAAEESGDRLGAALMRALKERTGGAVRFSGVGGHDMAAEGLKSPFPIDDLAIVGPAAVPRLLPTILRRIRQTAQVIVDVQPDVLVIIDSPDFTHRVARRVRAASPAIPIVDYVSPSVWAWRPWRARSMRRYVDHVLALLPFEPGVHRRLGGPPCTYVGHPLTEKAGNLRPNAEEAQRRLADPPVVLALPGSRKSEIQRRLGVFGETLAKLGAHIGPIEIVLPTVRDLHERVTQATATWPVRPRVVMSEAEILAALRVARVALTKSGTITLELALAGVPMVAAYKVSAAEAWIARRLIRVPSYILANLVLGENVVPEMLQEACTADHLTSALLPLIANTPERNRQLTAFSRLDSIMQTGRAAPSERAAEIVLELASGDPNRTLPGANGQATAARLSSV
jgi:lipid-A-disaccharide synthase